MADWGKIGKKVGSEFLKYIENESERCERDDHFNDEQKEAYRSLREKSEGFRERYLDED